MRGRDNMKRKQELVDQEDDGTFPVGLLVGYHGLVEEGVLLAALQPRYGCLGNGGCSKPRRFMADIIVRGSGTCMGKIYFFNASIKQLSSRSIQLLRVNKLFRHISSALLVLLFMTPTVVKLEHHHEHFVCHARGEKHLHEQHEQCAVCNFEFSLFEDSPNNIFTCKSQSYLPEYNSSCVSVARQTPRYSFQLRAPPLVS